MQKLDSFVLCGLVLLKTGNLLTEATMRRVRITIVAVGKGLIYVTYSRERWGMWHVWAGGGQVEMHTGFRRGNMRERSGHKRDGSS